MASRGKHLAATASALLALASAHPANAAIPICVDVRAPTAELEGLKKLVKNELERHPSHEVVVAGCQSNLMVELFDAGGARYLTAQIEREVPARFGIREPLELGERLADALRLVLHNDPAYLSEDLTHLNELQRLGRSITVWGRWMIHLETFEFIGATGTNVAFVPGLGAMVTRGHGNWQVFGRIYGGGKPLASLAAEREVPFLAGFDGGLSYEFFDQGFASPYVSAGLGLQYAHFSGRPTPTGPAGYATLAGVALSARVGVRFFRWHPFDLDIFAQAYTPFATTKDVDGVLFGESGGFTPSVQVGLGVGF